MITALKNFFSIQKISFGNRNFFLYIIFAATHRWRIWKGHNISIIKTWLHFKRTQTFPRYILNLQLRNSISRQESMLLFLKSLFLSFLFNTLHQQHYKLAQKSVGKKKKLFRKGYHINLAICLIKKKQLKIQNGFWLSWTKRGINGRLSGAHWLDGGMGS